MSVTNESWTRHLPRVFRERLYGRLQLQKILSNIAWLSLDKVLRLGVSAVIGVWMARYLGRELFGIFNYAAAYAVLFSPLAVLGLDAILVRDILREDADAGKGSLGTAFAMRVAGGIGAFFLVWGTIALVRPGDLQVQILVLLFAGSFLFQPFDVIDCWFQSIVKSKYVVYAKNTAFLLSSAVRIVLLSVHAPLIAFAWTALGESAIGAAGLLVAYRRKGQSPFRWRVHLARAVSFLRDSWPVIFAALAVMLYMRIGQVMVGDMLGDAAVGAYSVAVRIAEIWYFIPMSIAASVFPSILKARAESADLYRNRLQKLYDLMSGIAVAVAAVTSFAATPVVSAVFGAQYRDAGPVLAIHIWASVPVFLGVASGQYLMAENLTRVILFRTIAGGVASVLLNVTLIPLFGIVGAAISVLASYVLSTFSLGVFSASRECFVMMVRSLNITRLIRLAAAARGS